MVYKTLLFLVICSVLSCCASEKPNLPLKKVEVLNTAIGKKQTKQIMDTIHEPQGPSLTKSLVMGKFNPSKTPNFVRIARQYSDKPGRIMQDVAYEAFKAMHKAALEDGITLVIKSATRNFDYQKGIWERKWTGATTLSNGVNLAHSTLSDVEKARMILLYSSMPGTSRHHWGTDIDLNAFNNAYFETGKGLDIYNWLRANAADFGFCQPYTAKNATRPKGYEEEKWHWSYLPLAIPYLQFAEKNIKNSDIVGFKGDHTATTINVVEEYILGIHKNCTHGSDTQ